MKRLGILGAGHLSGIVARAWKDGLLPGYELVGITSRGGDKLAALCREVGCPGYDTLEKLLDRGCDIVAECAGVQAVRSGAIPVLESGSDLAVLSIGALADPAFYEEVSRAAEKTGRKVHLASGAIGGFDVLRTVCLMGGAKAAMETRKSPGSLQGTPVYTAEMERGEKTAFEGTPAQAIALLPTKVNVSVAAALATTGPEEMAFAIQSVPGFVGDDHKITVERDGVRAVVDVYSSTSAIAAWSVVALLRDLTSPIQFG